jgi:glycosyltransferase involved in cell wall biosynthesis
MNYPDLHLYTHEFFPTRGGIATYCHEFANAAAEIGFSTMLHAPNTSCAEATNLPATYTIDRGSHKGNHNLPAIFQSRRKLAANLKNFPGDIHLLAEPGPILAYGTLKQSLAQTPKVYITLHGSEIQRWANHPIGRLLAKRAFSNATGIRAVSGPIKDGALATFPSIEEKLKAVPNALPQAYRTMDCATRKDWLPNEPMEILSVGRIHPRKGYDQVIRAIAQLPEETRSRMRYTIAGASKDNKYLKHLHTLAKTSGVALETALNLSDIELSSCFRKAQVFALTSMPYKNSVEGFGLVYLEAGAHGLPCLAYDTGGVKDAVLHGQTGYLIPQGDLQKLSQSILRLFKDPALRTQLGQQNRQFALKRTWKDVVTETLLNPS